MKKTPCLLASAVLSLLFHALFFLLSRNLELTAFAQVNIEPARHSRPMDVHIIDIRDRVFRPAPDREAEKDAAIRLVRDIADSEKESLIKQLFQDENLIELPKPELRLQGLGQNILQPELPEPSAPREIAAPRPEILEIAAAGLDPERLTPHRDLTQAVPRRNIPQDNIPSLAPGDDYQSAIGESLTTGMRVPLPKPPPLNPGSLPPDFFNDDETDPGQKPRQPGAARGGSITMLPPPDPDAGSGTTRDGTGRGNNELIMLDPMLEVSAAVLPDPTGGGYFRLDIRPTRKSDHLKSIPKDILFLIDSSLSITPAMHRQFKAAAVDALQALNPNDRFNVVSFNVGPTPVFPDYVETSRENIALARERVEQLQRVGMTDVFAALAPYVNVSSRPPGRPLNIFLLSDGESTVTSRLENQDFIRQIHELNREDISIYSFSAGRKANRQLMDFLAYNNRGKSIYHEDTRQFRDELMQFLNSHADIIVADLKYTLADNLKTEAFPKNLPHLYRGETLSVYGRYPTGTDELIIQVIGQSADDAEMELMFRMPLAKASRASHGLALDWASQKIMHLILERTVRPAATTAIQTEINRLSQRYKLFVPY